MREDADEWDEEQAASGCCHQVGTDRLADGLREHVGEHDGADQWEADYLPFEGHGSHADYVGVAAELLDDDFREGKADDGAEGQENGAALDAEIECVSHAAVELGAITEATERLESLPQANHYGVGEETDSRDDAHAGNGSVAVCACRHVEGQRGDAGQALSGDGGSASHGDFFEQGLGRREVAQVDADVLSLGGEPEEHEAAKRLADERGDGCARDAQLENEDEQRGQDEVEQHARSDASHGIHCVALETHQVVERERHGHERCSQQHDAQVTLRVRQDGGRGAQEYGEWGDEKVTEHGNQQPREKAQHYARGGHLPSQVIFLGTQLPGHIVARAVAEEEADGLDDGHDGKRDAHGSGTLRVDGSHEISVGKIIHAGG